MIVTELGVFDVIRGKGIVLRELAPGVTLEEVLQATDADIIVTDELMTKVV